MSRAFAAVAAITVIAAACSPAAAPVPAEKPEKVALAAARAFLKGLEDRSPNAMLAVSDLPFRMDSGVVRERDKLTKEFEVVAEKSYAPLRAAKVDGPFTAGQLIEYLEGKEGDKLSDEKAGWWKDAVGTGQWAVVLDFSLPSRVKIMVLIVRVKDGRAWVTGMHD
jgi:hypothetical protein